LLKTVLQVKFRLVKAKKGCTIGATCEIEGGNAQREYTMKMGLSQESDQQWQLSPV